MAYSAYDELLQRRLLEHGGMAGAGGSSQPTITPAGGGSGGPQMPSGITGLLGNLFSGGGSSSPFSAGAKAQYAPEGQPPQEAPSGAFNMGNFGDKLMDFSMGAAFGRNPNESIQYGIQGLFQGSMNRRQQKAAQAELNRTRHVAISMGVPEDIAMNAPPEILVNVIKELYAAGLKPKQPIILSKGQRALDPEGKLIGENPDDSLPNAEYETFIPPNTIPGAVPQTIDVSRPSGRALADRLTNERWIKHKGDAGSNLPSSAQEYEYAKAHGFKGSYEDFLVLGKGAKLTESEIKGDAIKQGAQAAITALTKDGTPENPFPLLDSLAGLRNTLARTSTESNAGTMFMDADAQVAYDALKSLTQQYIYAQSGQQAPEQEVLRKMSVVMPVWGDKPERIAQKKAEVAAMMKTIEARAKRQAVHPSEDGGDGWTTDEYGNKIRQVQ